MLPTIQISDYTQIYSIRLGKKNFPFIETTCPQGLTIFIVKKTESLESIYSILLTQMHNFIPLRMKKTNSS